MELFKYRIGHRFTVKPEFEHMKPGLFEVRGVIEKPGCKDWILICDRILEGNIYSGFDDHNIDVTKLVEGIKQGLISE